MRTLLFLVLLVLGSAQPVFANSMILLALGDRAVQGQEEVNALGIKTLVLDLSTPQKIFDALLQDLPATEAEATAIVKDRAAHISTQEAMTFLHPLMLIKRWDIKKLPALVINDGEAVLYGSTDFTQALALWQESLQ